jgi:hypothetical protein
MEATFAFKASDVTARLDKTFLEDLFSFNIAIDQTAC